MSKRQNPIQTEAVVGLVTVRISGESIHSNKEAQRCAELLAEALGSVRYNGEFKVIASMQRLNGAPRLQGLSVSRLSNNAVLLGYQPGDAHTRATYTLQLPTASDADRCYHALKSFMGTAYLGGEKERPKKGHQPVVQDNVDPTLTIDYYTLDQEWMETFVLILADLVGSQPNGWVDKCKVLELLVECTSFEATDQVEPIFNILIHLGYLAYAEGTLDCFTLIVSADVDSSSLPKANDDEPAEKNDKKRNSYLRDDQWVASFMDELKTLVASQNGLITRSDLYRLIMRRANQVKVAGTVQRICKGLQIRGYILSAGEKTYRVVYEPDPDTAEQALAELKRGREAEQASAEHKRAETAKMFDGFAMFKMPSFAEGMFDNKKLLEQFLGKVNEGTQRSADIRKLIDSWYPRQHRSTVFRLLDYLVGRGYLVRPKSGQYDLGPTGRDLLGIVKSEVSEVKSSVLIDQPPPAMAPVAETVTVLKETEADLTLLPASALIGSGVVEATARVLAKATANKAEADASELEESKLRARRDSLRQRLAAGPSPEAVEAAVMEKLLAMANEL